MPKSDELLALLPNGVASYEPLDFSWEGVKEAFVFTSAFNETSYALWVSKFVQHVETGVAAEITVDTEEHPELAYLVINIYGDEKIDIHVAWCQDDDAFGNLNAWLGSRLLKRMVDLESPRTAGVIRVEDPSAFFPDDLD
ncbi:hypothetical protein [Roseiconus lacunae]|uniref:Uncharacterized protein n=1 Tax=Roseiconus lacunae TaxID=2605694 RepID=A0ABT7PTW3_9BACT|nr:hypothetical protein [Roseiconus lacunae]MDM4019576.1 hypothetical protein [Roseiconus lacunae]